GHASLTSPAGAPGPPRAGQVASRSWQASPRPARNGSVGGFDGDADPELAARDVGHPGAEHVALGLVFDVVAGNAPLLALDFDHPAAGLDVVVVAVRLGAAAVGLAAHRATGDRAGDGRGVAAAAAADLAAEHAADDGAQHRA